jgi:SOS-response transcriptional repressor LexA
MSEARPFTTADRLNQLMTERNLKQVDIIRLTQPLSAKYGVTITKPDLSQYKNGKVEPGQDKLYLLAAALDVSEAWLMGYDVSRSRKIDGGNTVSLVASTSTHTYPYYPADIAAGALTTVEPVTSNDIEEIELSDAVMGKYAGSKDIIIMRINGESMNRVIPNHSLIGVKRLEDTSDLDDGDIVVFCVDDEDYSVKRFYDDKRAGILSFTPDSDSDAFHPINFRREDADGLQVIGRVITYVVNL